MGLKIRLRKQGRLNRPFFRLVLMNTGTKRDGKYLEMLGWYNPIQSEEAEQENFSIKPDRIDYWLGLGAEISDNARSLVKRAAPEVLRKYVEKTVNRKITLAAKRRVRRKAVA